jgi:putative ABC transport system permease protein
MDLKFALRSISRSPGFALLSVLILALGIGANTAIFSVVYGVILRPLTYSHPEQLVSITTARPNRSLYGQVSGPDFLDLRAGSEAFQSMAAYGDWTASVVINGKAESVGEAGISEDFLHTLSVRPVAGRALLPGEFNGNPNVTLVSEGFWQRHFGDSPFSAGHVLKTGGRSLDIVGVLPAGFHFPDASNTEVWYPFEEVLKNTNRSAHNYRLIGRLRPRASIGQAQAQLSVIANRLAQTYPGTNRAKGFYVTSLSGFTVRRVKTSLYLLLGAVGLVLLIACANIANLLLARGAGRLRELAIRSAMGASQPRIMRQLFTETLLLAAAGASAGVLMAYAALPVVLQLVPSFVPRLSDVQIDWRILVFCGAIALLSCLLSGLAPALQASRTDPNRDLRNGGARGVLGGTARMLRQLFVTVEIALCLMLLVSAGLLLRSFTALTSVDLGFHPEHVLVANIDIPDDENNATVRVLTPLLDRLSASAEVRSAALTRSLPGDPDTRSTVGYIVSGQTLADFNTSAPNAGLSVVSGSYFDTIGVPLLQGRTFSARDDASHPLIAIVNQALVRRSFGPQNPIGQKILCGFDKITMQWMTIAGVVADARLDDPKQAPMPELYLPQLQHPLPQIYILVKTRADPMIFAQPLRTVVQSLDNEAVLKLTTLESHLAATVALPRFSSMLVAAFAGLAVLLAAVGIYGVIAYSVSQRTTEIGLRMALGAKQKTVLNMVLKEALKLVGMGLTIGLIGSAAAARLLRSQLFEVSPADPAVYAVMLALLLTIALVAAFLPAWRASRVEPLDALRQD